MMRIGRKMRGIVGGGPHASNRLRTYGDATRLADATLSNVSVKDAATHRDQLLLMKLRYSLWRTQGRKHILADCQRLESDMRKYYHFIAPNDQCPLCPGIVDSHRHVTECPNVPGRDALANTHWLSIYQDIQAHLPPVLKHKAYAIKPFALIPSPQSEAAVRHQAEPAIQCPAMAALNTFPSYLGNFGYIPATLKDALATLGVEGAQQRSDLARSIASAIHRSLCLNIRARQSALAKTLMIEQARKHFFSNTKKNTK